MITPYGPHQAVSNTPPLCAGDGRPEALAAAGGSLDIDVTEADLAAMSQALPTLWAMVQAETHATTDPTLGWCDSQIEFEFTLDLLLDGLDRILNHGWGQHHPVGQDEPAVAGRLRRNAEARLSGRNPDGGNHRGSIFRRRAGPPLIQHDGWPAGLLDAWMSPHRIPAWAEPEARVEQAVSVHIGAMPFLWLAVPDEAGDATARGIVERNSIALLSALAGGIERTSSGWLGNHAPFDPTFLETLAGRSTACGRGLRAVGEAGCGVSSPTTRNRARTRSSASS